ncbi:hypothetical protein OBBRIDRAFT_165896 [Obba rivulosa]|uniref:Transmembrane protein n=1 Tax=Obba rivulosa TaxID=1052685 RepID=A0A8E2DRI5_9APHY|nr:hypothetical protein OBBRIDRAFT_165896 [Obba rivulosa]
MTRMHRRTVLLVCLCCLLLGSVTSQDVARDVAERAAASSSSASSTKHVSVAAAGADLTTPGNDDATQTALPVRPTSSAPTPASTPVSIDSTNTPLLVSISHSHGPRPTVSPGTASVPFAPHHDPPNSPPPTATSPTVIGASSSHSHHQPAVAIVFEVLAGVVGLIVVLVLGRCCYSWQKTPRQDRIAALMNRHALDREMAELERARLQERLRVRQAERVPPPPPYIPDPPAYDAIVQPEQVV